MNTIKLSSLLLIILTIYISCNGFVAIKDKKDIMNYKIEIDTTTGKPISPYIYGINDVQSLENLTATAHRLGGNRMTGYNWENNFSNAGNDWHHFNDEYMVPKNKSRLIPAITYIDFVEKAKETNAYVLITLPMAGYVSNDNLRTVEQADTAPSKRFAKLVNRKNSPFTLTPDLSDGIVHQDECLNYLINKFSTSHNGGINAYSLDNEPALWTSTHPRIHPEKTGIGELIEKSISLASVVKDFDPAAEIFGPALYGVGAYTTFQDAPDWANNYSKKYKWFIDAYLDEMRLAEEKNGKRLLDVLDIHYYTEARCPLDHRVTDDNNNNEKCYYTRMQSARTLWDISYREKSWISRYLSRFLPILPVVNESIKNYYPGTKLAITEYNFGNPSHVSGGIAQADALGIFASHDVYFATLWPLSENLEYAYSGINLYTNYDGKGSTFGDYLVSSKTDNTENSSIYASTDKDGNLHVILLNKNIKSTGSFSLEIKSDAEYNSFETYGFDSSSYKIKHINSGKIVRNNDNSLIFELPPMSAYHVVLRLIN